MQLTTVTVLKKSFSSNILVRYLLVPRQWLLNKNNEIILKNLFLDLSFQHNDKYKTETSPFKDCYSLPIY